MSTSLPATPAVSAPPRRFSRALGLALIILAFLAFRLPVMYRQTGGEDEDCYAVPGLTILYNGLPRLPHVPARNLDSVYYGADRLLYAEPPLFFYVQSLFYLVFPRVYGTARLESAMAGIGILLFVWMLTEKLTGSRLAAFWGTGLLSLSRWFYFPATRARPDILGGLFGFAAIWTTYRWLETRQRRYLVWTGVWIGLGGLSHFFAIVYAVQIAVWLACLEKGWRRLTVPAIVAAVAMAVAALWIPLILIEPEVFLVQFKNQCVSGSGDGLLTRLLVPWDSLRYHVPYMARHIGPRQFPLAVGALALCTWVSFRRRDAALGAMCLLAWSSMYLLSVLVGLHHPVLGYWVYPAGLMFVCVGWAIRLLGRFFWRQGTPGRVTAIVGSLVLALMMGPGSGIRTWIVHITRWNDINYNGPAFARKLMDEFPADEVGIVDTNFTFDFIAAGRPVLLAQTMPFYFRADTFPYDYMIVSRFGLDNGIAGHMCPERLHSEGLKHDLFACYADIYRPAPQPCPPPDADRNLRPLPGDPPNPRPGRLDGR